MIDPAPRTLEVFALREGHWLLERVYQQDEAVCAAPFAAITFPLEALWA